MSRFLIILGIMTLILGFFSPYPQTEGFGRLPGDIYIAKDNFHFYFPFTTSSVISTIINVVLWTIDKYKT